MFYVILVMVVLMDTIHLVIMPTGELQTLLLIAGNFCFGLSVMQRVNSR